MKDLRCEFNTWYFNVFHTTSLYACMVETVEDSPWHRECNVGIHTDMVVGQYVGMSPDVWSVDDLNGAFACAFHDVGKPPAEEIMHSAERGTYRRYTGHELMSTRLWEDFVTENWDEMVETFNLVPNDIYVIGWVIEHHLPYGIKKRDKVNAMVYTARKTVGEKVFARVLKADTLGKICDDHAEKIANNAAWIEEFFKNEALYEAPADDAPIMYMLIGASGSGKSTFTMEFNTDVELYSWDQLRLDWYIDKDARKLSAKEQSDIAYEGAINDKQFIAKVNQEFMAIVKSGVSVAIDNTNTSNKRRKFFIAEARRKGYRVRAVLFPVSLDVILSRQETRAGKSVPPEAVIRQYRNLQYPFFGEFDEIQVLPPSN